MTSQTCPSWSADPLTRPRWHVLDQQGRTRCCGRISGPDDGTRGLADVAYRARSEGAMANLALAFYLSSVDTYLEFDRWKSPPLYA